MNSMLKGLLAAAIASAALAGPALAVDGVTDKEILIGTHLDLSGPVAAGMPQLRNAIQMRIDEANEAGGVNGRKLRIVVEDNGSQPQLAVRAVEKLMRSENVFAFLQPFGSGPNSAVVKRVTDAKIVYFAPWGSSDAIRAAANNSDYLFNIQPNYDTTSAPALVHMIKETGAKKIGHIYQ